MRFQSRNLTLRVIANWRPIKGTDSDNIICLVVQSWNGIQMEKSLAVHYFKFGADQEFDERGSAEHVESMKAEGKAQAQGNPEPEAPALKRAVDDGDGTAQVGPALCLLRGDGIPMDTPAAAHYFRLGADQGNAIAQFNYGIYFGNDVPRDRVAARRYFELGADQ
jgi:TPR repeat protein